MSRQRKVIILHRHRFDLWNAPGWLAERLARDFAELRVVHLDSYDQLDSAISDAEAYIGWSLTPEQFAKAKQLRWIHSPAAAVHQLMFPELLESAVTVTNARTVHGAVVAESVMALLLALARRLPTAVLHQSRHEWGQAGIYEEHPRELRGATLLLVGYGAIGRETVRRALPFEMKIVVAREHPREEQGIEVRPAEDLDALLPQADFVVLAAPLTAKTRGLFNRERLGLMKPGAYLVNVGRGPLIEDGALLEALREKRLAGAALDVFATEPLPKDSPLWDAPGLLITPHTAALAAKETLWERHYELISGNMRRWLRGEPLLNVVNKQKGY